MRNKLSSELVFVSLSHPILHESPAELYMLGMLSMMDRMLNIPMKQLVDLISIDSRIQEALLGSRKAWGGRWNSADIMSTEATPRVWSILMHLYRTAPRTISKPC